MVLIEEGRNSRVSQSPKAIFFEKSRITKFLLSEVKEEVKETRKKVEQIGEKFEKKFEEIQQQLMDKTKPRKLMKLHCYLSPLHHSFSLLSYIYFIKFFHAREGVAEYQRRCVSPLLNKGLLGSGSLLFSVLGIQFKTPRTEEASLRP